MRANRMIINYVLRHKITRVLIARVTNALEAHEIKVKFELKGNPVLIVEEYA